MDLQTFITETLTQIVKGVDDAIFRIAETGAEAAVNPGRVSHNEKMIGSASPVEFDVAVVVSEETSQASGEKAKASAGLISVVSLRAAGELESGRSAGARNEMTSRIKFTVQLAQPGNIDRAAPPSGPLGTHFKVV